MCDSWVSYPDIQLAQLEYVAVSRQGMEYWRFCE